MSYLDTNEDEYSFDALPVGNYQAMIEKVELRQTKAKQEGTAKKGEMIAISFDILDDNFASRKVFERYNVQNDNDKAQQIGRGQFSSLCKAIGVVLKMEEPKDANGNVVQDFELRRAAIEPELSRQLREKVLVLGLGIEKNNKGNDVNVVKKYISKDAKTTAATGKKDPF